MNVYSSKPEPDSLTIGHILSRVWITYGFLFQTSTRGLSIQVGGPARDVIPDDVCSRLTTWAGLVTD